MALFKISTIGRTYRHVKRYRRILTVLFKYGFGDLIDVLKIEQYLEIGLRLVSKKRREKIESHTRAERVRMAIEELGPTFIKMGQILSTRPDLLPAEFIMELPKLQDNVPSFPFHEVKMIIEKELKKPLENIFSYFDKEPLAAASIGQVHKATTMEGDDVVVKVQRPGIQRTIEVDLEIMLHLATLMEKHLEGWDIQQPSRIVEEFASTLEKELDYTLEAAYMERFTREFEKDSSVHIPKLYRSFTTSRILTMEHIKGIKSSNIELLDREGVDRCKIAERGFKLIMKQIFVNGFFHADPHPGNIFILPENVIGLIDFGMIGRINQKTRENFADLMLSIVHIDEAKATDLLLKLTVSHGEPDYNAIEREVAEFMDQHCFRPLKEIDLGKLLNQLLEVSTRHRLSIPPDLFLMVKALSTVEGLGRLLDPDFDVIKHAAPFVRRLQFSRINPKRILQDVSGSGFELFALAKEIPGEVREILKMVRHGNLKMDFEHRGLEPIMASNDKISNRLSFAIVLASLIIGSALIVLSDVPPKWHEIPIIGLAGFVFAGIMGFWLLISFLRSGKM